MDFLALCKVSSCHAPSPLHHPPVHVDVLQAVVTRWSGNPMAYGSYSSVGVGSTGCHDYEAMAKPLGTSVFFAGEATSTK